MALFGNAKFDDKVAELGDLKRAVIRVDKLPDPDPALDGLSYQLADYQAGYVKNHLYTCIIRDGKAIWKDITSPYRIEHLPAVGTNDFGNDFANSKCYMANLYCDCDYMHIVGGMRQSNRHIYEPNWRRHYQEYAGTYYLFLLMASTKNKEFVEDDKWVKGQLVVKETKLPDEFPYTVEPMYFRPAVIYELTKRNWGDEENPKINPFGLPDVVLRTDGVIPCAHFLQSDNSLKDALGFSAREDIFKYKTSVSDSAYAVTPVDERVTHDLPEYPSNREDAKKALAKWQFFGALLRKYGLARGYYKVGEDELKKLAYKVGDSDDKLAEKDSAIYDEVLYIKVDDICASIARDFPNSVNGDTSHSGNGKHPGYCRIKPIGSNNSCRQLAEHIRTHTAVYRYIDINSPTRIWWSSGDENVTVNRLNENDEVVASATASHRVAKWGYIEKYLIDPETGFLTTIGDEIKKELDNKFEEYYNAVFSEELYPSRVEDGKVLLTYNIRHEYTQQPFIIGPLRDMDEKIVRKFRVFHTFSSGLVMYEGFQEDEYRMVHRIGAENSKWCKDALERSCAVVKRENTSNTWYQYPWFNLGFDCYHGNSIMYPTGCSDTETWRQGGPKQPLFWNLVMFYEQ